MKHYLPLAALLFTLGTGAAFAETTPAEKPVAGKHWEAKRAERHAAFEAALAKLPADKAALVKQSYEKNREGMKEARAKMRELHEQERALLVAPKFDQSAYLAKSAEIEKIQAEQHRARAESMAEVASQLSASERQTLADDFKAGHRHGGHGAKGAK